MWQAIRRKAESEGQVTLGEGQRWLLGLRV